MHALLILAVLLLVAGLVLYLRGQETYQETGLPSGDIIYQDTVRQPVETEVVKPLFSQAYRLAGKPDYLVEDNGHIVPVEVKSGRAPARPYESHVMQLAAYCLLVNEVYGQRPDYGIIRYADRNFTIPYDEELEALLLQVMESMRYDINAANVTRSHHHPGRCRACSVRDFCEQALL